MLQDVDESKLVIRADRNFHFPSAEVIRNALNKAAARNDADGVDRSIVLDMHSVHLVDHTTLKVRTDPPDGNFHSIHVLR